MRGVLPVLTALFIITTSAAAQSVWIGGRVGTLGVGADISVAASDWFILRGGAGLLDVETDLTTVSGLADNRNGILALPKPFYTVGADIEVGNFRIGGGMLYKSEDPHYAIRLGDGASIAIGEGTYTEPEVTQITATLLSDAWAPYALVGFGQHTSSGLGLFLDIGVAFLDHPKLQMSAAGDASVLHTRGFREDLRAEQRSVRGDMGDLVNFWPILSLGVRYRINGHDRRRCGRH